MPFQPGHPSTSLQTEKLRPRKGQRSASRTRGQVRRSPRAHLPDRLGLGSQAQRCALAEPQLSAGGLGSVCLSTQPPPCRGSWTEEGERRGQIEGWGPPTNAAKTPGCRSLNSQPGLGQGEISELEYLMRGQVEEEVAASELLVAPRAGAGRQLQPELQERSRDKLHVCACGAVCLGGTEGCAPPLECISQLQGPTT